MRPQQEGPVVVSGLQARRLRVGAAILVGGHAGIWNLGSSCLPMYGSLRRCVCGHDGKHARTHACLRVRTQVRHRGMYSLLLRAPSHISRLFFSNPNYSRHSRRTTTKLWPQFKRDLAPIRCTTCGLQPTGSPCDAGAFRPRCHFPLSVQMELKVSGGHPQRQSIDRTQGYKPRPYYGTVLG